MCVISVISPTYRREDYLARCAESVLSQEVDADIEYIVVNDAAEPLQPATWMDDPRARVVTTCRAERAFVRNTGAALARGDYLYFLDDDDRALPGAFQALLDVARDNPDAVHVYGAYEIENEVTQEVQVIATGIEGFLFPLLLSGGMVPMQASWVRRDAFLRTGGYPPRFVYADDYYFLNDVCRLGRTVYTPAVVARVRVNHNTSHVLNTQRDRLRQAPEYWTGMPDTFALVRRQTRQSPEWAGGCVLTYLRAAAHAGRRGSVATLLSRLCLAARLALPHAASPGLWRGLRKGLRRQF